MFELTIWVCCLVGLEHLDAEGGQVDSVAPSIVSQNDERRTYVATRWVPPPRPPASFDWLSRSSIYCLHTSSSLENNILFDSLLLLCNKKNYLP